MSDWSPRKFQKETLALAREVATGVADARRCIHWVTTGAGKSSVPVIFASQLVPRLAAKVCWVVPRESLRQQAEQSFLDPYLREWLGISQRIRASVNDIDPCRTEDGYVTTYQAIAADPFLHRDEFDRRARTGRGYLLVLDEWHHVETEGLSQRHLAPLVDQAAFVVLMTGTLGRGDKKPIAFLSYRLSAAGLLEPDLNAGGTLSVTYTRAEALDERAVLPVIFTHVDFRGSWIDSVGDKKIIDTFAQVATDDVPDAIYTGLNTQYAYEVLDACVKDWRAWRTAKRPSQLLVVANRQEKAREYATHLRKVHNIVSDIATIDEGDKARQAIKKYKARSIDCLVTVGMAYEGLDVEGISHIACLTHIRSKPWIEQMIGRAVRVDRQGNSTPSPAYESQRAHVFVPDDALMRQIINEIEQEQLPFLRNRKEREGDGPLPSDRQPVVPLNGEIAGVRISEMQGEQLAPGETERILKAIEQAGLSGVLDPISAARFIREFNGVRSLDSQQKEVSPSEEEATLLYDIEQKCRRIDSAKGVPFGTTNTEVKRRFGTGRPLMSLPELRNVWAFLCSRYGSI